MSIRKKVLLSFIVLMFFILLIGFLSLLSTFQIKDNYNFAQQVTKLINIQEDMNEITNFSTYENNIDNLNALKNNFITHEKNFEALREEIEQHEDDFLDKFLDKFLSDIYANKNIENSLNNLYTNEHHIETLFDEIYNFQAKKLIDNVEFEIIYPKENDIRKKLQQAIFQTNSLYLIQEFGNLRYYSKETLYQHKDEVTFKKWKGAITNIIKDLKTSKNQILVDQFEEYKAIVQRVGELAINIEKFNQKEQVIINKLKNILKENRDESLFIEASINQIQEEFLNNIMFIQLLLAILIAITTIFLTTYISSKLSTIIQKMNYGVQELRDGNYDATICIKEDHEFDEIANTFNKMAKNIKENTDTLEEKIEHRTKELQGALVDIQQQKDLLENLSSKLAKYLSPQVFESIFQGKQDVILESKREYLTVFFSDIKGFTSLTDTVETEVLTSILNEYLDVMSQIVLDHGGTIDKYIGDSIMVFYGDPVSLGKKQDAINCVKMAIKMNEQMSKLRIKWQQDGLSNPFHIRMGIHSGHCTVGNFGSKNRLDYTIVGGVVNLASRLESSANDDEILISSETYMLIKEEIGCTKSKNIQVKGIAHDIQTYQVTSKNASNIITKEQNGFNLAIDFNEINKEETVKILQNTINGIIEKQ